MKTRMKELCAELGALARSYGAWVRLHYVYPYPAVDDILPLMAEGSILPYLDVPIQHAHPAVLKAMKRPASGEKNIERIAAWRAICPDLTIRSTFIAGFPGETEEQFQYLLDFLSEAQLDRVGCFAYSPVEGATANQLADAVPEEVREERRERLMALQAGISSQRLQRHVGRKMQVLVDNEARTPEGRKCFLARSPADAPEIDGMVVVAAPRGRALAVGDFVEVRVTSADEHDLHGEVAG